MAVVLLGRLLCVAVLVSPSSAQVPANVAVGKHATQSSTFDGADNTTTPPLRYRASADLAVDGASTKNYADKTCAITDWLTNGECTNNPWWQVDLGGLYDIFNVTIYQREAANNRGPLVVRVGDHVERPENRSLYNDRPVIPVTLSPPVRASTVNISIIGCNVLQLCEVEIFAIEYVNECDSNPCQHGGSCIDAISSYTCHCLPGYTDPYCATDIAECSSSPCSHNSLCVDGINNYTCYCATGYTGFNCLDPCSGGSYGPGCSVACSAHCPETSDRGGQHCDRTTGQCLLQTGCKNDFQGLQCNTKQQSSPADRYTEGLGTGLGVGLGALLLLSLIILVLHRCRHRRNSLDERSSAGDIQLSSRQMQEATRQQEGAPGQVGGFYESLDASFKDRGHSGPYAELGEARGGQGTANL